MRSEQEMLQLIVNTAKSDDRIRAVVMTGSRANTNARRDIFQDFDIVYFVTEIDSFKKDHTWINRFGERIIMQMPEDMQDPPPTNDGSFVYLMQFADGNRIDLTLFPLNRRDEFKKDSLGLLLMDKDGTIESLDPPSESDYLPKPPTAKAFSDCCNEFWWVCPYVAKGLWREEVIYAKHMLDRPVREQLMKMLTWYIGVKTDFLQNTGELGKHFKEYLEPELWAMVERTYSDAGYENTWAALGVMCDLFRCTSNRVAEHFGFEYPQRDDERVSAHLKYVRFLPKNATEIY